MTKTPRAIGWLVRYTSPAGGRTVAWRATRRDARAEALRWHGATIHRVTEYPGCG